MAGDVAVGVSGCEGGRKAAFVMGAEGGVERNGFLNVDMHFGVLRRLGLGLRGLGFLRGG